MRVNLIPAGLMFLFTTCCMPQALADSDSHREAVLKLLELTQMQQKIDASVGNVVALQLQQDPAMRAHEAELRSFLEKYIGWTGMKDELVEMYMQTFSEAEVKEMNAFYGSATGKKMIELLPQLIQERDRLAMQRLQAHLDELQQEISGDSGQ